MPKPKAGPMDILIGCRLRACRSRVRLSQRTVAGQLGITQQQYRKYESGETRIALRTLGALAAILQTSLANLVQDAPTLAPHSLAGLSEVPQAAYLPETMPGTEEVGAPKGYGEGSIPLEELWKAEDRETLLNHFRELKRRQARRKKTSEVARSAVKA